MRSLATGAEPQLIEELRDAGDAELYRLLHGSRSGPGYVEEGSTLLTAGVTDYTIPWVYQKVTANLRFNRNYVEDPNDPPQDIRAVIMEITTVHVKIRLSGSPTHGNLIWRWQVVAPDALVDPNAPGVDPQFVNSADVVHKVDIFVPRSSVVYASKIATLDSDVLAGGGTNAAVNLAALNAALAQIESNSYGGRLIFEGAALVNGNLRLGSRTVLEGVDEGCGAYLASGSNCHLLVNSNFVGLTNPGQPDVSLRQKDIAIIGGTWNMNYPGQSEHVGNNPANSWCTGIWFDGVDNAFIQTTIYDARKFALMLSYHGNTDVIDYTARWPVKRNDNNDVIHTWGPATGKLTVRNLRAINGNDDTIALNYTESADPGNGGVVWSGQAAAVCVDIDGVYIENGCSVMRLDAAGASVGTVTVRNVVAVNHGAAGGEAGVLLATGIWDLLRCEDWTIKTPAGVPFDWPKNCKIIPGSGCGVTELVSWRHTGISAVTGNSNLVTIILDNVAVPAQKVLLENFIVDKPSASRWGSMVVVDGPATALALKKLEIRDSELLGAGYAYLCANAISQAVVGTLDTGNSNTLNGATGFFGERPLIGDKDELSDVGADVTTSVDISLLHNTATPLPFNTETNDTNALHSTASNTSRQVAPSAGKYDLDAGALFEQNATGLREIRFVYNRGLGSEVILKRNLVMALAGVDTIVNLTRVGVRLNAGDFVEVIAVQTSGSTIVVRAGAYFSMTRRG